MNVKMDVRNVNIMKIMMQFYAMFVKKDMLSIMITHVTNARMLY
jgi:hypothetical protein